MANKITLEYEYHETLQEIIDQVAACEGDTEQLTAAISEKSRHTNLSLQAYAKNLLKEAERRGKLVREKNTLISNMVRLKIPEYFYTAKVKFDMKPKLYKYFNEKGIEIPPLLFFPQKQAIYTFADLTKETALGEVIVDEPVRVKIDQESEQFIIRLINQHLRRLFWKKDLVRINELNVYLFECRKVGAEFVPRTCTNGRGKEKVVCTPEYKIEESEKKLNFIYHHAASLVPKKVWGGYYILINPVKEYTIDGITPIDSNAKDAIDRKFRNPLYNRSSNELSDIRFWHYYLFESDELVRQPAEDWFKLFKYGKLEEVAFDWKPQTIERGQVVLGEDSKANADQHHKGLANNEEGQV